MFKRILTIDLKNVDEISNIYAFIGECYDETQKSDLAIINLKKALEFDNKNKNAEEMLKRIENKLKTFC